MKFAELYDNNRQAVEQSLASMWCGEARNESQKAYIEQLHQIIPGVFAPRDAMPLVQCMNSYESVYPEHVAEADALVGTLWRKTMKPGEYYPPYEHQYQSWHWLLSEHTAEGKKMSICVTTGTGSGKTECFMLPLVQDLLDHYEPEQVQAIFLYPLNALMEDQKKRMQQLLKDTPLTFAVYNGDLPQMIPPREDRNYEKVMRRVDAIRGIERDEAGNIIREEYPNIIATRDELRRHPANILLTNPTMLEYILLRSKDQRLIGRREQGEKGPLRWIALDETHTYTGAGATEMAMLIRRVLMAYDVTTDDVRFATSSATIGNGGEAELRNFISGITGLSPTQVHVLGGRRKGMDQVPEGEDRALWLKLMNSKNDGYLRLDELITEGDTISEKLQRLDAMCQRAQDLHLDDLRVKVHFFYRVPNHGLFVDISDPHYERDGSFRIYTEDRPEAGRDGRAPLLELSRCKHCGEYLAIGEEVETDDGIGYRPITTDDSDMFDLDDTEDTGKTYYIFGTSREEKTGFDNNVPYHIEGNQMRNVTALRPIDKAQWHVIANTQCQCPYCGTKLTKHRKQDEDNPDFVQTDEEDRKKLLKFRVAPDFISRLIAPSTLDQMIPVQPKDPTAVCLHQGQQYISFVDSRQMAARSTIKQNLVEERQWVYSTVYRALKERTADGVMTVEKAIDYYNKEYDKATDRTERRAIDKKLDILESDDEEAKVKLLNGLKPRTWMTWKEVMEVLLSDRLSETFCMQFAERTEMSPELDEDGHLKPDVKRKYILAIMVEYLSKRPLTAAAPETMGLFSSYYPELEEALTAKLPDEIERFNSKLSPENQITKQDWYGLMKIFLDLTVRSNQSVFLKMDDHDPMDIFQCVRFATTKERRRSVHEPNVDPKKGNRSRVIRLLAQLIANEHHITLQNALQSYGADVEDAVRCLWKDLTLRYRLLEHSTHYDDDPNVRQHVKDKDEVVDDVHLTPFRLNLARMAFRLYDDSMVLCDTNAGNDAHHVAWPRPVMTTFHAYSPYLIGGQPVKVDMEQQEEWREQLWGNDGAFTQRVDEIKKGPEIFIQAEHTAQVDKMISRKVQTAFKDHQINILACSTTMEMGVDLGDLELVMMQSVPPLPSNYKQRAGRSGRRGQVRSACVTLCGSDAVGIRTLLNPMENLILRKMSIPTVDMNSLQVIQRHVNAFLVREFGVFAMAGGSAMEQVVSYYTNYTIVQEGESNHVQVIRKADNAPVSPVSGLGDPEGTPYAQFNERCYAPMDDRLREKLERLLAGTILSARPVQQVVQKAEEMNKQCYAELELRIQDYAEPYKKAKSDRQRAFFNMKFIEPLAARLLSYWATHRFTPNANMPVNVIEFDVNSATQLSYSLTTVSNPSYPLRTALSQYAPGNPIARDGIVRIVRGIRYTNFFKPEVTFKKLYFNREQVVIDAKDEIEHPERWSVSGKTELDLLQPAEFVPDMNESASRILDNNVYTRVSAQLIGADEWHQDRIEPHLFDMRSSREGGNGEILYYNEGMGYGYCHCTKCGRTVLENWPAASASDPEKLPSEMNTIPSKDSEGTNYHFSIIRKGSRPNRCLGCNDPKYFKRNVVLGDTIQTDYTEIRIRHFKKDWINSRQTEGDMLVTLALLFARALAEELNVERTDIDFTITPNGHICIFDANPGGSGYANQLAAMDLMKTVIERSAEIIESALATGNKEALIDKYTLFYLNRIDIAAAKAWIDEERSSRKVIPENIVEVFGNNVTETSLAKMLQAAQTSDNDITLFVDDDYEHWDYDQTDHSWKGQFMNRLVKNGQQTTFCVAANSNRKMGEMNREALRQIKAWTREVVTLQNSYAAKHLYPLAYINGRLFFTNNPNHILMNDSWGNGTIYYIRTENPATKAEPVELTVNEETTKIFMLTGNGTKHIKTDELFPLLREHAADIFSKFFSHCKAHPSETLKVSYQDEHLKSVLGMMLTLQTIQQCIKTANTPYTLTFRLEQYLDDRGFANGITTNQPSDKERDQWLQNLAKEMVQALAEEGIEGTLTPIVSLRKRELTHWRVLQMECAGKRLSIYPDGGFMNGWVLDNRLSNTFGTDLSTLMYDDEYPIFRKQEIKFDVVLE